MTYDEICKELLNGDVRDLHVSEEEKETLRNRWDEIIAKGKNGEIRDREEKLALQGELLLIHAKLIKIMLLEWDREREQMWQNIAETFS